ncbi:uncharacterized protein BDZ99DRAFT_540095 [Mytilinidion resinicola]|uniref:SAE2-domain-containing protein n=1 Tax=Mytilinidion resinicola TaxID=574789 RepID=A0A6A6YBW5_9PEZI|nr:uncharacterized protein BDZ99DRAFT_540095 [Mytilinidion resinicola]KAF2805585.1 hypothetical protein BDZ99DRAFT_540095 [Mytilinidion resinicola]
MAPARDQRKVLRARLRSLREEYEKARTAMRTIGKEIKEMEAELEKLNIQEPDPAKASTSNSERSLKRGLSAPKKPDPAKPATNNSEHSLKHGRSAPKKLDAAKPPTSNSKRTQHPHSTSTNRPVITGLRRARSASPLREKADKLEELLSKADELEKRRWREEVDDDTLAKLEEARREKYKKRPTLRNLNRPSMFLATPKTPAQVLNNHGVYTYAVPQALQEEEMHGYPTVIYHEDKWMELCCSACGGNAIKPTTRMPVEELDWVKGIVGFHRHLHYGHGIDIHKRQVASACKVREFNAEEVRKMRARALDAPKITQKWCVDGKVPASKGNSGGAGEGLKVGQGEKL